MVLATGGIGHLYAVTTNPAEASGLGLAIAARAGAVIADPEFVQFHPTAIMVGRDPAPLATEALRGEGATLINDRGERFMLALHPLAELAPRDIVARGVFAEIAAGRGAFLDATRGARRAFRRKIPDRLCKLHRGRHRSGDAADPDRARRALPYGRHRGGCARPHLAEGLWAGGEVSCTGAHGANRLASNSLLEAVVYAARIAEDIGGQDLAAPTRHRQRRSRHETARCRRSGANLRTMMTSHVGVIRDGDRLAEAVRIVRRDRTRHRQHRAAQHGDHCAAGRGLGLGAARKPRRALPQRLSGRKAGAGTSHHDDAGRGARDCGIAVRARIQCDPHIDDGLIGAHIVTNPASCSHPEAFLSPLVIDEAVHRALDEDLGRAGDVTSIATIPEATHAHAVLVARQAGMIAGLPLAVATFRRLSADIRIEAHFRDGGAVAAGVHC